MRHLLATRAPAALLLASALLLAAGCGKSDKADAPSGGEETPLVVSRHQDGRTQVDFRFAPPEPVTQVEILWTAPPACAPAGGAMKRNLPSADPAKPTLTSLLLACPEGTKATVRVSWHGTAASGKQLTGSAEVSL